MEYKILNTIEEKTIKTLVKFDFLEDPITISHFMPQSEEDIIKGIENRYISEKRDLDKQLEVNEE